MYKYFKYVLNKISIYTFGVEQAKPISARSHFRD